MTCGQCDNQRAIEDFLTVTYLYTHTPTTFPNWFYPHSSTHLFGQREFLVSIAQTQLMRRVCEQLRYFKKQPIKRAIFGSPNFV